MKIKDIIVESSNMASAEQIWDYVGGIHPKDQQGGGFLKRLIMRNPQYELKRVPLSSLHVPNDEDEGNDPYGRAMFVDVDHAREYSQHHVDKKPVVADAEGHILDGAHRAWAAAELLNRTDIMAWVPAEKLTEIERMPGNEYTGGKKSLRIGAGDKNIQKLPGSNAFVYSTEANHMEDGIIIKLWDSANTTPKPVQMRGEDDYEFDWRLRDWERNQSEDGPGTLIGKLVLEDVPYFPLKGALQVDTITVDEDYRGQGVAKSLYGVVLSILRRPLLAGRSQTPGGRRNWLSLASVSGVDIKGYVMINEARFENPEWADKDIDTVMGQLGGQYIGPSRPPGIHYFAFDVVPGSGELAPAVRTELSKIYDEHGSRTGLYATWSGAMNEQGVAEGKITDTAITLSRLGKFHSGEDTLAEFVPERSTAQYALHPDKWESTFYSLTNKDSDKVRYYGPKKISIPPGTLVGDMAIANKFYRAKTSEEKQQYAEAYKASLQPYPVDVSKYRMPELLIPKQGVAEEQLDELFQQGKQNWTWKIKADTEAIAKFSVGDRDYVWQAFSHFRDDKPNKWEIQFRLVKQASDPEKIAVFGTTGTGNSAQVMSVAVDIMREFLQYYGDSVQQIAFDAKENSRIALYRKMVQRLLPNWSADEDYSPDYGLRFTLNRPKSVAEDTQLPGDFKLMGQNLFLKNLARNLKQRYPDATVKLLNDRVTAYHNKGDDEALTVMGTEVMDGGYIGVGLDDAFTESFQGVLVPTIKQTTEQLLAANPGTRPALFLSTDNWNPDAWTHIATKLGYRLVADDESLDENFADGKNPGRKGLAKRSGVNTKASVSTLRNVAKHSSGEKQRMAHWLANMKAGRAKKK